MVIPLIRTYQVVIVVSVATRAELLVEAQSETEALRTAVKKLGLPTNCFYDNKVAVAAT